MNLRPIIELQYTIFVTLKSRGVRFRFRN